MASVVNVCSVDVLENPGKFGDPFKLEITFECYEPLVEDLDWELVYVGSGESNAYDQILDSILVGPVGEGRHKFIFEADGPDPSKIPESELVGVTVLLLKCRYMEQEFINIGWFVATEYTDPELQEEPPASPILEKLQRRVCIDDVRVTTFAIKWHRNEGNVADSGDFEDMEVNETTEKTGDDFAMKGDADADKSDDLNQDIETNRDVEVKIGDDLEIDASLESKATIAGLPLLDVTNESIPDLVD
ncbi:putative histone chaperone asf-1-like protein [Dirofilaria immitis]|nr:Histone chaperone asf1b-B [Dirofilaria immitis]